MESSLVVHGQLVSLPGLHLAVLHPLLHSDLQLGHLGLLGSSNKAGGNGKEEVETSSELHLLEIVQSSICDEFLGIK